MMILLFVLALLVVPMLDILLLSRAPFVMARLAFIPLATTRRIKVAATLANSARVMEPIEPAGYRVAPTRRIDPTRLPWPEDLEDQKGLVHFDRTRAEVGLRTKWYRKRIPSVGRLDVQGDSDEIQLRARFIPSPLSVLVLIALIVAALNRRSVPIDLVLLVGALVSWNVVSSVLALRAQLERAVTSFSNCWSKA